MYCALQSFYHLPVKRLGYRGPLDGIYRAICNGSWRLFSDPLNIFNCPSYLQRSLSKEIKEMYKVYINRCIFCETTQFCPCWIILQPGKRHKFKKNIYFSFANLNLCSKFQLNPTSNSWDIWRKVWFFGPRPGPNCPLPKENKFWDDFLAKMSQIFLLILFSQSWDIWDPSSWQTDWQMFDTVYGWMGVFLDEICFACGGLYLLFTEENNKKTFQNQILKAQYSNVWGTCAASLKTGARKHLL